jgi:hypothetical protein
VSHSTAIRSVPVRLPTDIVSCLKGRDKLRTRKLEEASGSTFQLNYSGRGTLL